MTPRAESGYRREESSVPYRRNIVGSTWRGLRYVLQLRDDAYPGADRDSHGLSGWLDLSLLDMTGYHLAQSLRDRAQSRGVRLIALTSSPEHAGREQARAAGFERYLIKPIASVELSNVMEMSI